MKQRSDVLTACIALLIIFNGVQALRCIAITAVTASVQQKLKTADMGDLFDRAEERDDEGSKEYVNSFEMTKSVVSNVLLLNVVDVVLRLAVVATLIGVLFWKRLAVWSYVGIVLLILIFDLISGTTLGEVAIELIGPAILIATIHVVEPIAWPQFE